jgi:photosystem II stability/assembly factor-like uncharacterized protein
MLGKLRLAIAVIALPALPALPALAPSTLQAQSAAMPVAEEFNALHFRSIGPAIMSGRISDLAVYEANPAVFYVGTAHGGVWKTTSNGAVFTPLLQDQGLMSIGDVAVSQTNPDLVWVGTGESNNRQSTSWGDGAYKSTDGGKTFQNMGLRDSKHINRIVIDPHDNNIVLVAATGPLFGAGGDRGVYKTTDGGQTWKQVLKVDDETGANDLAMSYVDSKILFASTYQRRRTACCVNGGGPGSGIWRSVDGGDHWERLANGLPTGPLGRIGLDIFRRSANIVYANIEGPAVGGRGGAPGENADTTAADTVAAGGRGGRGGGGRGGAAPGAAPTGNTGVYRSDDGGQNWRRVGTVNPRPLYFSQMRIDPSTPDRIYMGGVKMQMSIDGGKTFATNASLVIHDDIHAIWIDPANSDHVMIGGDGGIGTSYDMAKSWQFMPNLPVGLFYHVGYDMDTPYNVCGGMQDNYDWCGPSASREGRGIMNYDWFQIDGGDGFVAVPDPFDSRIIYTETQDGSIIRRNKVTGESKSIRPVSTSVTPTPPAGETFRWHWDTPMILSPATPGTLIVAANRVFKSTDHGDSWTALSPDLTTNAKRDTIMTMGVKGADITIGRDDGIVSWPTIVALAESPKQAGVYYTGTDDGVVSLSRDGGKSWQNITSHLPGFPAGGFVSEVVPSRFDAATVYVTVDNHRLNDFAPYMWVSNDFGATFKSMVNNVRGENVRTLTEDQKNPDVLYIGTETGIFLSLDRGRNWRRLKANLPTVRVDEITLHPRDNAMLVATHGRALWILDHLEPIQEYTASQATDARLFTIPTAMEWKAKDDRNAEFWGHQYFVGENPPFEAVIQFFLKKPLADPRLRIADLAGHLVRTITIPAAKNVAGIQTVCWDLRVDPIPADSAANAGRGGGAGGGPGGRGSGRGPVPGVPGAEITAGYLPANPCAAGDGGRGGGGFGGFGGGGTAGPHVPPGKYSVGIASGDHVIDAKPIKVMMDPEVRFTAAERKRYDDVVLDLHDLQRRGMKTASGLNAIYAQMSAVSQKVKDNTAMPADMKAQFATFSKDFDSLRVKFGVPTNVAQGGRGGGGGRGGAANPANVLGRTGTVKSQIMGIWESPSPAMVKQYASVKRDLPKAISEADAFIARARAMSATLKKYDVTLDVR